jgi:hypothetical protein
MARFGLALALILCVIGILYIAPALRSFAHQLGGDDVATAGDLKASVVHAAKGAR